MNKITNVSELKRACSSVAKSGEKEYVLVDLTKEVLDFLYSIYGKNRPENAANMASLYKVINDGEWNDDQGAMTINASATWLCSGHHRLLSVIASGNTSLKVEMQILPDDRAERKFLSDDTLIATRTSAQQASMFLKVKDAQGIHVVAKAIENYNGNPNQKISVEGLCDFAEKWGDVLESHKFYSQPVGDRQIPRYFYAIAINLKIKGKTSMYEDALAIIDSVSNANCEGEASRLIREQILQYGIGEKSPAINTFMKTVVKGDNGRSKAFVRDSEIPSLRDAVGIVNTAQRSVDSTKGSRNYFRKVINSLNCVK